MATVVFNFRWMFFKVAQNVNIWQLYLGTLIASILVFISEDKANLISFKLNEFLTRFCILQL